MKKIEAFAFLSTMAALAVMYVYLLSRFKYGLGWDTPTYMMMLQTGIVNLEPVYFMMTGALSSVVGVVMAMKFMSFLMPMVLSTGVWLLVRKYLPWQYALFGVWMVNMFGTNIRIWTDLNRNYLFFAMLPWYLMLFLDDMKESKLGARTVLLCAFTFSMVYTYIAYLFLIPLFIYGLFAHRKKALLLLAVIVMSMVSYFIVFGNMIVLSNAFTDATGMTNTAGSGSIYLIYRMSFNIMFLFSIAVPFLIGFSRKRMINARRRKVISVALTLFIAMVCLSGLINFIDTQSMMTPELESAYIFIGEHYYNATLITTSDQENWISYMLGRYRVTPHRRITSDENVIYFMESVKVFEWEKIIPYDEWGICSNESFAKSGSAVLFYDTSLYFQRDIKLTNPCLHEVFRNGTAVVKEVIR